MELKFVVTSENQQKLDGVNAALGKIIGSQAKFSLIGISTSSGVSEQPMTLEETKRGAINRIMNCKIPEGIDYIISVESGVEREFDQYYSFTFCAISNEKKIKFGFGTSSKFIVPDHVSRLLNKGCSLGEACHNSQGLISELTGGIKPRTNLIEESIMSAVIPFHFYQYSVPKGYPESMFKFIDRVSPIQKNHYMFQLKELDFRTHAVLGYSGAKSLEVADVIQVEDSLYDSVYANGIDAIKAGEVAVVIMSGGQGSRLGSPIPKALVQLDIPSKSTLLELQLRRIKKLIKVFSSYNQQPKCIPVYILTSEDTHSAIAAYLLQKQNFGLSHVRLFQQENLPARDNDDNVVFKDFCKIFTAPNGNGSVFESLCLSGCLKEMKELGVKYVDIHPIDNALARPADPYFIGQMIYEDADSAIKVVRKASPQERVGTVCKINGKTAVVEYSEIPSNEAAKHMYGNTAMHLFSLDIIEKVASVQLPYHVSKKKEECVDDDGNKVMKDVKKYERFIFDALDYCQNCIVVECEREEEFAPVKNASGTATDNPETARDLILSLHQKWAFDVACILEGQGQFEILPETSYSGEGLEDVIGGMTIKLPTMV